MDEAGRVSALSGRESSQSPRAIDLGRLMRYQAGVAALRQLRRLDFTEKEIRFGFVKIEPGASFILGRQPSVEVTFLKSGSVEADGRKHETLSAFSTEAADQPATLTAVEEAVLFYAKLPTFAAAGASA